MRAFLLAGTTLLALAAAAPARADYVVTFSEVGGDVVASGVGTINTNGLFFGDSYFQASGVDPSNAALLTGAAGFVDVYLTTITGPGDFGAGSLSSATTGTGDLVGFGGGGVFIAVPMGYASGASLAGTATYEAQSFASLGLTLGSYGYTFNSGADTDTITVNIGAVAVPEPASLTLLGTSLLALGLARRRRGA